MSEYDKNATAGEPESTPKIGKHIIEEPQVFQNDNVGFPGPDDKKKKVGKKKQITITFRENRTFELNLGHEVMRFVGRETKPVDAGILKHPAFIQARKDFNIKGI